MTNDLSLYKKIVFTGPESTAKTSISQVLADEFNFVYVTEFARKYIENLHSIPYTYDDVIAIAEKQKEIEEYYAQKQQTVIFDTDLISIKIWLLYYNWELPAWLHSFIQKHQADLYLLMKPDIEWVADAARENPHNREELFALYENELQQLNANYLIITGTGEKRIENCRKAIRFFWAQTQTSTFRG